MHWNIFLNVIKRKNNVPDFIWLGGQTHQVDNFFVYLSSSVFFGCDFIHLLKLVNALLLSKLYFHYTLTFYVRSALEVK